MNPYRVEPPFYVSFSGGRTSGYLLRHVLDAWGGSLPEGGHVLFANTGKEHGATFRKDRASYAQPLTQVTVQGHLFQAMDDTTIPCDCTE